MAIESASYIAQLDQTNPGGGDSRATSDDHHRLIKTAVKQTFPNMRSEVSASAGELNQIVGMSVKVVDEIDRLSASYHSAVALVSANLDAKIDSVSAQLSTTSAALDLKIETGLADLSATLDNDIRALSATLAADISAVSSVANAALPTSGGTVSGSTYLDVTILQAASFRNINEVPSGGATPSVDWTLNNKAHVRLNSASSSFSFTDPLGPTNLLLKLVQDGSGSRLTSWPAAVKWAYGTAPTLSTTAGATDIVTLYFDGSAYHGSFLGGFE